MRKIKRFVLNDSFTVLSAEAQKNVLGGAGPWSYSWDGCQGSSTCATGNASLAGYSWGFTGNGTTIPDGPSGGWTGYGHCAWDSSTNSCFCNIESNS